MDRDAWSDFHPSLRTHSLRGVSRWPRNACVRVPTFRILVPHGPVPPQHHTGRAPSSGTTNRATRGSRPTWHSTLKRSPWQRILAATATTAGIAGDHRRRHRRQRRRRRAPAHHVPGLQARGATPTSTSWRRTRTFESGHQRVDARLGRASSPTRPRGRSTAPAHSKALNVPAYTTVMPPNICLNSNEEWMRFFYKDPGVERRPAAREDRGLELGRSGRSRRSGSTPAAPAGRSPTQIPMPNKRDANGEQTITLTITPVSTAATWRLDDIMIDPWVSR